MVYRFKIHRAVDDQIDVIATFGIWVGPDMASSTRRDMMTTGTRRSGGGGGGSGGNTSGSTRMETVSRTRATADLALK
ncbi:hypothetical protein CDL15_Pgr003071 [Punica granatum]|uniref:Uncharacterized protein n=1 Tax=Punica granatum TaxID=22663 RepID=A0A218X2L3_PUNGR|nr:hypothetical protein CDL15_Pgr003071 [Punica granatum]